MKKIIFFTLCSLGFNSNTQAQNCDFLSKYIATYEFEYQLDSLNPDSKRVYEPYVLIFNEEQSYFASNARLNRDTQLYNSKNLNIGDIDRFMKMPKASSNKRILNTIQPNSISFIDDILSNEYYLTDPFQLEWKLVNEKDSIGILEVKKAETNFRGRDYIAWYCEDLPFSFGPYKFSGLPGLIIRIHDSKNQIFYSLTDFKKIEPRPFKIDYSKRTKNISIKEFQKLYDSLMNNPIPYMEAEGVMVNEQTKALIRNRFDERRKNNKNRIELTNE